VDCTECDAHLTKDDQLIVMHDGTVDRTTNGAGAVRDLTFAEVLFLDAGPGECVPKLAEVLEVARDKAILLIELKGEGVERQAVRMVSDMQVDDQVVFTSFHLDRIREVRRVNPSLKVGAIFRQPPEDACRQALEVGASGIGIHHGNLRRELVDQAHRHGLDVQARNPDTVPEIKTAIVLGTDGVGSNRSDLLIPLVRSSS
jgi:glycerophosphoryl diester phosphodiesterase